MNRSTSELTFQTSPETPPVSRRHSLKGSISSLSLSGHGRRKSIELGDRLENTINKYTFPTASHLWIVILSLFGVVAVVMGIVTAVNELILGDSDFFGFEYKHAIAYESPVLQMNSTKWRFTNTSPLANLDDSQIQVFVAFIVWLTVVFAGIGLELLVWVSFLRKSWSEEQEAKWKFAQFLFPLLITAAFGLSASRDYMSIILMVPGMWKFGFPETLTYMHCKFGLLKVGRSILRMTESHSISLFVPAAALFLGGLNSRAQRVSDFLNSAGTILHHTAACFVMCLLVTGVARPDRFIVEPTLIVLAQHWFALLHYVNKNLYTVIELVLEIFWEWVMFSNLQYIFANHWAIAVGANTMLVAHWFYLAAASVNLIFAAKEEEEDELPNEIKELGEPPLEIYEEDDVGMPVDVEEA